MNESIREEAQKKLKEVNKAFQLGYREGYNDALQYVNRIIDEQKGYDNTKHWEDELNDNERPVWYLLRGLRQAYRQGSGDDLDILPGLQTLYKGRAGIWRPGSGWIFESNSEGKKMIETLTNIFLLTIFTAVIIYGFKLTNEG